jgi:hypothetical protein
VNKIWSTSEEYSTVRVVDQEPRTNCFVRFCVFDPFVFRCSELGRSDEDINFETCSEAA